MFVQGVALESAFGKMSLTLSPVPVGGGSLARVQSGALPLTLHADMLTLPDPSADAEVNNKKPSNRNQLTNLPPDFNSPAVEIGSSDSLSSSRVSVATSNLSSSTSLIASQQSVSTSAIGELHTPIPSHGLRHYKNQQLDASFVDDILASSGSTDPGTQGVTSTKCGRPFSAPTRATSDSGLPSPYATDSPTMLKIRSRRTSGEDKRQRRLANIAESARAAMTYTAIHRSKKTESLPRDHYQLHHHWRSHSGSKSVGSEDELLGSSPSSVSILGKGSAPAAPTDETKTFTTGSPSGSLNLHSLSIDETRKASMTEMEEIWKLVENESGSSSTTSVDTSGEGVAGSSGGGGRRLPSIALESHLSPQHTASGKGNGDSPVFEEDDEKKGVLQNGHLGLDVSVTEGVVKGVDQIPLQSTPKRPGLAAPNMSLLTSGPRPSPVTRKGDASAHSAAFVWMNTVLHEPEVLSIHVLFLSPADLDSLLTTLKSLGGEGRGETEGQQESTGLRLLEQMLHSNTFKRAQKVQSTFSNLAVSLTQLCRGY